ncbi:MAG: hypothetical protein R3192_03100 [Woeseiaceae bacterium]|nr:hypothetical protein [Woeseiaceae bacterium]
MGKTLTVGILLGLGVAAGITNSISLVDLHREPSQISVQANGGNVETFRIDLPRDRIFVGLAGEQKTLPADIDWPQDARFGNFQAELFKVRDRNDVVVGVASRMASASEPTGAFIEWVLHLPARGTLSLHMDVNPAPEGHRNGRMLAGSGEFATMVGEAREQFFSEVAGGDASVQGRIELITILVGTFSEPLPDETADAEADET